MVPFSIERVANRIVLHSQGGGLRGSQKGAPFGLASMVDIRVHKVVRSSIQTPEDETAMLWLQLDKIAQ